MKTLKTFTTEELRAAFEENEVGDQFDATIVKGLPIAVYENEDLGHPHCGFKVFLTFGGPESTFQEAPPQAPDSSIYGFGWRYLLLGTWRP